KYRLSERGGSLWPDGNRRGVMTIYGMSQSSGVERRLRVELGGDGVVLTITNHDGNVEQGRIMLQPDGLLMSITNPSPGGCTIEGIRPPHGVKMLLDVEVRRNEVLLRARKESEQGCDVAIGLDDFQDALEKVIG